MAGDRPLISLPEWLARHTSGAPPALRRRVSELASAACVEGSIAERLADAGRSALSAVESHHGDRSAALDLLAADALITLALLAQAEVAPAALADLARALVPSVARSR